MTLNLWSTCTYCGYLHSGMCSRIEEIEYYENGTVKRVRLRDTSLNTDYTSHIHGCRKGLRYYR